MKAGKHGPFLHGVSSAEKPFNKHLLSQNEKLKELAEDTSYLKLTSFAKCNTKIKQLVPLLIVSVMIQIKIFELLPLYTHQTWKVT